MQSFMLHEFTESKVSLAISDVRSNSTHGIDGISSKFMKMAKVALAPILTKLFNKCLQHECFPDDFKVGQVIPIPTTLAPKELGEFRPITLLTSFLKFSKKCWSLNLWILLANIIGYTSSWTIWIYNQQLTELAITTIYDKLLDNLDKNQYNTCAILLDIKKAFEEARLLWFSRKIWNLMKSNLETEKFALK